MKNAIRKFKAKDKGTALVLFSLAVFLFCFMN